MLIWAFFKEILREDLAIKNLLSYGHCPFGREGVKPMSIKVWTAPIFLVIFVKKWSKMFITWWVGGG